MTIIEEFYEILCKQTGTKPQDLEDYGLDGYFKEGWYGEEDIEKAIVTLVKRRVKKN